MNILRFRERSKTEGRFIRQASSRDSYGHVVLVVEPSSSQMLSFSWEVSSEEIPPEYSSAVLNGITGLLERLELHCVETTVRVIGGSFNATDSSPKCYTVAAGLAFQDAISNSGVVTDAQPCGQPDLAHKAAQGRLP
ncbi:hypothetical protein GRF61_19435 [Azoarcus sp. TTM-91]|nr:hypothetical protein [Azoarcus sp. TTM-91]